MADFQKQQAATVGAGVRVRGDFTPYSSGMNNTANQLADALGVVLDVAPKIAQFEGDKAHQEGIDARIADVERENANEANKGLFAPLFRKRATDGFDFQDAQMDAPIFALEESMAMHEALKDATNPESFQAWMAAADAKLKGSLEGKSEVYRKTLAQEMLPIREQQARTFANWAVSNREKASRAAAAASAKSKVAALKASFESAGLAAYEELAGGAGDVNEVMAQFVTEAPKKFGLTAAQAREAFTNELITYSNGTNDPTLLTKLDPRLLSNEGREVVAKATDVIAGQRRTYETEAANAAEATAKAQAETLKATQQANTFATMRSVIGGEMDPSSAVNTLMNDPAFQNNPAALQTALSQITGLHSDSINPVLEQFAVTDTTSDMIDAALRGENPTIIMEEAFEGGAIRSNASKLLLMDTALHVQAAVESKVFVDIDNYEKEIRKVAASGDGADAGDYAVQRGLTAGAPSFAPGASEQAVTDFRGALMEYTTDWLQENQGNSLARMPRGVRKELQQKAFEDTMLGLGIDPSNASAPSLAAAASGVGKLNGLLGLTK